MRETSGSGGWRNKDGTGKRKEESEKSRRGRTYEVDREESILISEKRKG